MTYYFITESFSTDKNDIYTVHNDKIIFLYLCINQIPLNEFIVEIEPDYSKSDCQIIQKNDYYLMNHVIVKNKYSLTDLMTYQILFDQGITEHVDKLIAWAYNVGHLSLLKLLCEHDVQYKFNYNDKIWNQNIRFYFYISEKNFDYIYYHQIQYRISKNIFLPRLTLNPNNEINRYIIDHRDYFQTDCYLYLDYESRVNKNELSQYIYDNVDLDPTIILHTIIKFASPQQIQNLLDRGAEMYPLTISDILSPTLDNTITVKYLIEDLGMDYDFESLVLSSKIYPTIKYFLSIGNNISDKLMTDIITQLITTINNANIDYLKYLLTIGANEDHISIEFIGNNPNNNYGIIQVLLDYFPEHLRQIDPDKFLEYGIKGNYIVFIKFAIENGANVQSQIDLICRSSNKDILEFFCTEGNICLKDIGHLDNYLIERLGKYYPKEVDYMIKTGTIANHHKIFKNIIFYGDDEIMATFITKLKENDIAIKNLVKWIVIEFILTITGPSKLLMDYYQEYYQSGTQDVLDNIIIAIINSDYCLAKNLLLDHPEYQSDYRILLLVIRKSNCDMLDLLLDLNSGPNERTYLKYAFVMAISNIKIIKYLVEEKQIDYTDYLLEARYYIEVDDNICSPVLNYLYIIGLDPKNYIDSKKINMEFINKNLSVVNFMIDNKFMMYSSISDD